MGTIQENHQDLENAVQAKLRDVEHRKRYGSTEDRFKAWGEFLIKTGRKNLTLNDHYYLHRLVRKAMGQGISEVRVDTWVQRGKDQYTSVKPIKTREELAWID